MVPMLLVGAWLGLAPHAVYQHYVADLGPAALHDQRLAATIMWAGGLPAFAVPALPQMYELASAALTGGAGVVSTLGADSDVISGLVGAVELPETSAASA